MPPIISDCFESIIAAVYFDSQMDLNAVTNVSGDFNECDGIFGVLWF